MTTTTTKLKIILVFFLLLFGFTLPAQAALNAVGPVDPNNGYPVFFQDGNGVALALCLDQNGLCVLPPEFDPAITNPPQQIIFPSSFPDESFYWIADSTLLNIGPSGISKAVFRLALEAAFAAAVAPGEQIVFLRVNLKKIAGLTPNSTYIITHPFGIFQVTTDANGDTPVTTAGQAFRVEDGCFAPPCLTPVDLNPVLQAPTTNIGPFLQAVSPVPPLGYIGDPAINQTITPGPFGAVFRIDGPNIGGPTINTVSTPFWNLSGKLFTGVLPAPLAVERSTYARTNPGQVDLWATSAPTATVEVTGGPNLPAGSIPMNSDGAGNFFANIALDDSSTIPSTVTFTANNTGNTPTTLSSNLVDVVTISKAEYDISTATLTINASSSDQTAAPILIAQGHGILSAGSLVVPGLITPPAYVTVTSSVGGSDKKPVTLIAAPGNLPPVARDDAATTNANNAVVISVLANDTDPDGIIDTATVTLGAPATGPFNGIAAVNVPTPGKITYTPNPGFGGNDQFTYTVKDTQGATSNAATVRITVNPNSAPVAFPDAATTNANNAVAINVVFNDTDAEGNLAPGTVAIVAGSAVNGTAAANVPSAGFVTFTPAANFVGTGSFNYTVADALGAVSNQALVTITILNAPPVANPDAATTNVNTPVAINVVANDTDPNGNLAPGTVAIVAASAVNGTAAANVPSAGFVTFTPAANFAGTGSFSYTVADALGAVSNQALVTVTINRVAETLKITKATYTSSTRTWTITGTSSVTVGNTITVHVGTSATGPIIGSAVVGATGNWSLVKSNSPVAPDGTNKVTAVSTFGNTATASVSLLR